MQIFTKYNIIVLLLLLCRIRTFIYLFVYRAGRRQIARVVSKSTYYTEEPYYIPRRNIVYDTIRTRMCQ